MKQWVYLFDEGKFEMLPLLGGKGAGLAEMSSVGLPRRADRIADIAEFFSFGANDLTQTTLGLSRDDSSHFLPGYV